MTFHRSLRRRQLMLGGLGAAALATAPVRALAADYPDRPLTFICPWPAGGTADRSMRAI